MFNYPVSVEQDDVTGQFVVSCRDLPLMNSVGDTLDDALLQSVDAMVVAIAIEVDERRPIPQASTALPGGICGFPAGSGRDESSTAQCHDRNRYPQS